METQILKKKRNPNLDLLRIVSMLLIIWLHSIDHSGVLETADATGGMIGIYVRFTYMLVQVCVNCYVLISGYFLANSTFRLQKLVALWMEVAFYSVVIKLVFMLTGYTPFSILSLVSCLIPVFTGRYWFITIYFGLYMVSPFLNIAIHAMNREQHLKLNVLLFTLFSGMVSVYPSFAGMNSGAGWGLAWFVVLYFLAAWFRLYYEPSGKCVGKLLGWIGIAAGVAAIYEVGGVFSPLRVMAGNWYRYDSVPTYLMTVLIFLAFLNMDIKNVVASKVISVVAPTTLGVYLIHAHASFSPWAWEMLNLPEKMWMPMFPVIQLFAVMGIFVVCSLADFMRKHTVGRIENSEIIVSFSERIIKTTEYYFRKKTKVYIDEDTCNKW